MKKILSIALLCLLFAIPANAERLLMATTTSTQNTGLLDVLAPMFEADTGIHLEWVAVGTGKALELGRSCDVSVLMVHAPAAEQTFVDEGYGTARYEFMYNDFVIAGPADDPAGVKGMTPSEALNTFRDKEITFVSRGDDSGTHKKEKGLWKAAGGSQPDQESWYAQTGQGMMPSLFVAEQMQGYVLTDRGTHIKYETEEHQGPVLAVIVEGDPNLFNQYSVIPINPGNCPQTDLKGAEALAAWITSDKAQQAIADFRLKGKALFTPNAP